MPDIAKSTILEFGRGTSGIWLIALTMRRSGPTNPTQSSFSPNPSGPINARHRWRISAGECTGSVAVPTGGIGRRSQLLMSGSSMLPRLRR